MEGGIAAQVRQALKNMEKVLGTHGAQLRDVVKMNAWLTSKDDFSEYNAAYSEYFEPGQFPTRTTVVSELLVDGARIEIEAVAYLGE